MNAPIRIAPEKEEMTSNLGSIFGPEEDFSLVTVISFSLVTVISKSLRIAELTKALLDASVAVD